MGKPITPEELAERVDGAYGDICDLVDILTMRYDEVVADFNGEVAAEVRELSRRLPKITLPGSATMPHRRWLPPNTSSANPTPPRGCLMADELEDVVLGPAIALPTPTMSDVELFMDRTTRQVYGCVAYLEAALTDVREGRHDCARSTPALQQLGLGLYGVAAFYTGVVGALYREITEGMDPDDMKARTDLLIG